ncbi:MAG TPA: serine hydrolase domain-containing protein [Vicinamibacterales bacterium]|jgi:CubicO group peptidase (beta-lactamase class C family)|nr:serine hydrolase domain-containing protein [Vicinamibacterales bacterium]
MKYPITLVAVVLFAAAVSSTPAGPSSVAQDTSPAAMMTRIEGRQVPDRQGFDGFTLEQLMEKMRVPGVSVAVIKDFEIHWAKGYGTSDVTTGAPVTPDTIFQAASISKPTAAMGVMRLVQDGKMSLDAEINTFLKSWKLPASEHTRDRPVTLRALLSHTSGLGDGFGFPGYPPNAPLPSVVQILNGEKPSNTGKVLLDRPPFTAYKYSGGGVTIVQLAVTDTTGRAFHELMKSLVLDPIGMRHSAFEQPLSAERDSTAARAHSGRGAAMDAKWHVYPELQAAGLWTTPSDLARLAIELQRTLQGQSTRVLSLASAREMITPVGVGDFAVGFGLRKLGEGWYFGHGGSNWGFQCDLVAHVRKGYGVAIMTNADSGGVVVNEIRNRVAAAYNWDSLDKPVPR